MSKGGGGAQETLQQQQLQTEQSLTNANLNLEENQQRKSILNAMMGTRVFRGSALSRAVVGNTPGTGGEAAAPAPSASQLSPLVSPINEQSLIDVRSSSRGATTAGGAGASASLGGPAAPGVKNGRK
jgi:hypothetical protein